MRVPPDESPAPPGRPTPRQARPPWRVLATAAGAAALLHALLLAGVTAAETSPAGGAPQAVAMRVRTLPAADAEPTPSATDVPPPTAVAGVAAAPAAHDAAAHRSPRTLPRRPSPRAAVGAGAAADTSTEAASEAPADPLVAAADGPAAGAAAVQPPEPAASSASRADAADPVPAVATTASRAAAAAGTTGSGTAVETVAAAARGSASDADAGAGHPPARDDEMPVYKTVFPPPLTLHYDLRRGLLSGNGTLEWRPEGDRYEMRLQARVAGLSLLTQVSQGGFDDAGLAPRRYTDQRLSRAPLAANFNREQGTITFSGPSAEFPLLVGTQDRLSWMIQLAAVVSAEPRRLAPGGKVALHVVGARADAAIWVFRCSGMETVDTPGGAVRAARFIREPRDPHDTLAEAWLDPVRHGLPVRARVGTGDGGDAVELLLRDLQLP